MQNFENQQKVPILICTFIRALTKNHLLHMNLIYLSFLFFSVLQISTKTGSKGAEPNLKLSFIADIHIPEMIFRFGLQKLMEKKTHSTALI
jgi:predicted MPP superfamily phosphohydrolase